MKKLMMLILLLTGFCSLKNELKAAGESTIRGRVIDVKTKEAIESAVVVAMIDEKIILATRADENGYYALKPLQAGEYTVVIKMLSYQEQKVNKVKTNADQITTLDIKLAELDNTLPDATVWTYANPLISKTNVSTLQIFDAEQIDDLPYDTPVQIVTIAPGVSDNDEDGNLNLRGQRSGGTAYYVDGMKVYGSLSLPKRAIKEITVLTGGIPAYIGDSTGGVILITTKEYTSW